MDGCSGVVNCVQQLCSSPQKFDARLGQVL
jgi:hypothetical protein